MKKQPLPIGISSFADIRKNQYYYVDKTDFIREMIEDSAKVSLLPRPRRFGKTLSLDMLKVFFEKTDDDDKKLFEGLVIEKEACFHTHQGKYPVIFLTLKDIKESSWEMCYSKLVNMIKQLYRIHKPSLLKADLDDMDRKFIIHMAEGKGNQAEYEDTLRHLSQMLHECAGHPAVILIDEYDTPLHAGYNEGYYKEIVGFLRNFLSGGLKDNPHLYKGVLTGILRVAKESIFSGLKNLGVYTILDKKFSQTFGFTETEMATMLEDYGMAAYSDRVSFWYNGYLFGKTVMYNPWSVINFIAGEGEEKPYWTNTGDASVIDRLATRGGKEIREEIGRLLEGKTVELPVFETIIMRDLNLRDDLLWSFLLFSGYLKPIRKTDDEHWELGIPNREVHLVYRDMVQRWFAVKVEHNQLKDMLRGLEIGDLVLFERMLRQIIMRILSFHDLAGSPEKVYHALVLGMLVWLSGKYDIRSNRESGYGRFDIMMKPKDDHKNRTGIIIEFKRVEGKKDKAHEKVLEEALKQIEDRGYAAELAASGISEVLEIAVAFRGKQLWMTHRKSLMS